MSLGKQSVFCVIREESGMDKMRKGKLFDQ